MSSTTKDTAPAPPFTRETITKKALRLYPERTVEPLGHGRYSVEGTDGFYEVDLAVFGGEESCSCPDFQRHQAPCKHIHAGTLYRAKRRAAANKAQADRSAARSSRASLAPLAASL